MLSEARALVIACGALAREVAELKRLNGWSAFDVQCLPPDLHNRPERIPAAVRAMIQELRAPGRSLFVAYGDCGTGEFFEDSHDDLLCIIEAADHSVSLL